MPLPAAIATILPEATSNTDLFLPVEACLNPTVAVQQQTVKSKLVCDITPYKKKPHPVDRGEEARGTTLIHRQAGILAAL